MDFYSFALLLLLIGETHGLNIRETYQQQGLESRTLDQVTQCSGKTDTAIWHTNPDLKRDDLALEMPTTITTTCRNRSLSKRLGPPNRNVFNAICKRELDGKKMTRVRSIDVRVPVNGDVRSVATPGGGSVELFAEQDLEHVGPPGAPVLRDALRVTVINRSQCPIYIEWLTRLRIFSPRTGHPGDVLEARSLDPTPRRDWMSSANECEIGGLEPTSQVAIAVRLLVTAFGLC